MNTFEEIELLHCIALSMHTAFSDRQKRKQLQFYGSAYQVFKNRRNDGIEWPMRAAEEELLFIEKNAIQCFSIVDKFYPDRLIHIVDPPNLLYVKGNSNFNLPYLISIVGTRQHTYQVHKIMEELMEGLSHLNIGVISGLALGVDGIAHETALHYQLPTWGVLAHGLDTIYPNQHRKLALKMMEHKGGLITECSIHTPSMRYQFPKRNRIVAGMSDATIVIESEVQGGSMITANLARGYDREVFAVPGKIHDAKSKGCLWLIQNNIATMYHDPIQLLENMNWPLKITAPNDSTYGTATNELDFGVEKNALTDPIDASIYALIQTQGPIHKDAIAAQLKLSNSVLAGHLLRLELSKQIHLHAGNEYTCT